MTWLKALMLTGMIGLAAPTYAAEPPVQLSPPAALFGKDAITIEQFMLGTLRFVLLHELGHGFVDAYNMPVLGREEDAADRFATWWLAPDGKNENGTDAVIATEWWLASAKQSDATREQLQWWDEHGMDEQRGYQIACLLYGSDPKTMWGLAQRLKVPQERLDKCIDEAQQNQVSWTSQLLPQVSKIRHQLDGFIVPVRYIQPSDQNLKAAEFARQHQVLEQLKTVVQQFKFPEGAVMLRLVAQDCGTPNAFWSSDDKAIVLCYEMVDYVATVGYQAGFR